MTFDELGAALGARCAQGRPCLADLAEDLTTAPYRYLIM